MEACSICGAANQPGSRFCNQCGAALTPATTTTATGLLPPRFSLHAGRYQIVETLGQGGMGAVYKALDLSLSQRAVAIKEMSQQGLYGQDLQEAIDAFTRESSLLALLNYPGLPHIYEQFEDRGRRYLVMEFIEGQTLEQHLKTHQRQNRLLPVPQVLEIARQLCGVLEYLHSQKPPIIFRDLKPANVMLTSQGQVYLIDFGIARFFKPGQRRDTIALGSEGYAPPEQYRKATSPRSDIYGFGATLHQLLTGDDPTNNPFLFKPFSVKLPELERLVMSMVALDEKQRPANIQVIHKTLERCTSAISTTKGMARKQHSSNAQQQQSPSTPATPPPVKPSVSVSVLLSTHPTDVATWQSIRGQLISLIAGFPTIKLKELQLTATTLTGGQANSIDRADIVLLMLSPDFLASPDCLLAAHKTVERYEREEIEALSVVLQPCKPDQGRLASIPMMPDDAILQLSMYAREQRILEVARFIRKLIVRRLVSGKKVGPMNLLQWLLWQLYGQGFTTCPYFQIGNYALKNHRSSGLAGIMLHLFDLHRERLLGEYLIGPLECTDLQRLLQTIAPTASDAQAVHGRASRGKPARLPRV